MPLNLGTLSAVNTEINRIPYEAIQGYDADVWTDTPLDREGFLCRDYTLAKAKRLREEGWPPEQMAVILCWTEPRPENNGQREHHAVLGCDLPGDGGLQPGTVTWVLDNRFPDIRKLTIPDSEGYVWESRQVAGTTDFAAIA